MDNDAAVTMQSIADSLGLSRSTISLALRDAPQIAQATRALVQTEAARLGFVPNRNAVRLRTQQRNVVGLVVPDITNPVVAEAASGMQRGLESESLTVLLSNTFDDLAIQRRVLRALVEEQVAGVLLIPAVGTTPQDLGPVKAASIPLVLLNRDVPGAGVAIVRADDTQVVGMAFGHLTGVHGAHRLGYFGGIADAGPRIGRMQSFASLCKGAGAALDINWSAPSPSSATEARLQALELLERSPELPDGVIVHNDVIAMGLVRALNERGISPERLPVVSIDNIDLASIVTPSLTCVSISPRQLGASAGQHLMKAISRAHSAVEALSPHLVIRESCGCRATAESDVREK